MGCVQEKFRKEKPRFRGQRAEFSFSDGQGVGKCLLSLTLSSLTCEIRGLGGNDQKIPCALETVIYATLASALQLLLPLSQSGRGLT